MSRTTRRPRPRFYHGARQYGHPVPDEVRDGVPQYHSSGCRHHGDCDYCANNRTHASRRRAPIEDDDNHFAPGA